MDRFCNLIDTTKTYSMKRFTAGVCQFLFYFVQCFINKG